MNRHSRHLLMLILLLAVLIAGCAQDATIKPATSEPSETSAPAASQSSQTSASEASSTSVLPAKTGIPACDDYLASYKGCHRAAGIYAPDTIDDHYRTMRDTLLRESKDPTKRSVLEARCKSLANMLKDALHGKSCEPASSGDTSGEP